MRALLDELRPRAGDPAAFLTELNQRLTAALKTTGQPMFASAFYLVVDVGRDELRCANAGHPSPLLARNGFVQCPPEPALGLIEGYKYQTARSPLVAGDLLVLYSDGLYEEPRPDGERWGLDRLEAAVRSHAGLPADALLDALLADARQFAGTETFTDDVCLVGVEFARKA